MERRGDMPIYTYYCKKCDKEFDVIHDMKSKKKNCDICNSKVKRVYNFQGLFDLRGSGFYKGGMQE